MLLDEEKSHYPYSGCYLASVVIAYFSEASILYQDIPFKYKKVDGKWFTIETMNNTTESGTYTTVHCQNRSLLEGTFSIYS